MIKVRDRLIMILAVILSLLTALKVVKSKQSELQVLRCPMKREACYLMDHSVIHIPPNLVLKNNVIVSPPQADVAIRPLNRRLPRPPAAPTLRRQ